MTKLYYGNGSCTIEGSNIMGVEIRYKGAIRIDDKTSDSFVIAHQNNGILIFPNVQLNISGIGGGTLNDLFDYTGEFKVLSVIVADINAEMVYTTIHRVMDYTELLTTKSEDMTTKSEDLSSTYTHGNKVSKTILEQPHINNQHTSRYDGELYLQDGTLYEGSFHIHLADNTAMTGNEHTGDSQDLYFSNGKPTKNPSLIPYGTIEQRKQRKIQAIKKLRKNRKRY